MAHFAAYDFANQLAAVTGQGFSSSFGYDGLGNRYQQTANGQATTYTLDLAGGLSQVLYESAPQGYGEFSYYYGLGRISQQKNGMSEYFLTDALGSVRQITNVSGSVTYGQAFDPFGTLMAASGLGGSNFGYAGESTDSSGLQYLRARYYLPSTGRFISKDPFPGLLTQPASLTPYVYALNNPVLLTDPSGKNPLLLVGALGGLLGGTVYGYGSQAIRNLNQGMCFWDALSTNIDAGQVALYAGVGLVLGTGMGGAMVGIQALAAYFATGTTLGTALSADGDPTNEVRGIAQTTDRFTGIIYRNASGTPDSITPRIINDVTEPISQGKLPGLSFWNSIDKINPGKYIRIDTSKLKTLQAIFDNDPEGHVTVTIDIQALTEWANTRGLYKVIGEAYQLTQELWNARVGDILTK